MFQILVIDDDAHTRRYLSTILTHAGFAPHTAADAAEALELLKTVSIDLVILDIMMPGMDGYEFASMLRGCRYHLPILMLSARHLPENIKQGFRSGTDDYMTKPADKHPVIIFIVVDLPAPLGPKKPQTIPSLTEKEMSSTAL